MSAPTYTFKKYNCTINDYLKPGVVTYYDRFKSKYPYVHK